jgi:SAM-dependent methyltransferase
MSDYYRDALSAKRLERVYALAPPRVRQYLHAEIDHVVSRIGPRDDVLELGCGYGRVLPALSRKAKRAFGIDTSLESLAHGRPRLARLANCFLAQMDAIQLGFRSGSFDCTICIQNGISAFHVDALDVLRESVRVTRAGGYVLCSSYSDAFWEYRLDWFERQADAGLIGEIDFEKTHDGVIVCKDGFTATTVTASHFRALARDLGLDARLLEVDSSSIFCEIAVHERPIAPACGEGVKP